jgi:hypothetical protein
MTDEINGVFDLMRIGRGTEVVRGKLAPVPLNVQKIPHELTWD